MASAYQSGGALDPTNPQRERLYTCTWVLNDPPHINLRLAFDLIQNTIQSILFQQMAVCE